MGHRRAVKVAGLVDHAPNDGLADSGVPRCLALLKTGYALAQCFPICERKTPVGCGTAAVGVVDSAVLFMQLMCNQVDRVLKYRPEARSCQLLTQHIHRPASAILRDPQSLRARWLCLITDQLGEPQ